MKLVTTFLLGGVVAVIASSSAVGLPSSAIRQTVEGVSSLSYAPKPLYDDVNRVRVRFTTTGRARPGREYFVVLEIVAGNRGRDCAAATVYPDDYKARPIVGGRGESYTVWLSAKAGSFGLSTHFCRGLNRLRVGTHSSRHPSRKTLRWHRTISLRVVGAP